MPELAQVTIRLLGRFALEAGAPVPVSSRKARALLAFLAMQPDGRAGREPLAALLWGDRTDSEARQSLRQTLLALRKELRAAAPDLLDVGRDEIRMRSEGLFVDARAFAELAGSADPDELCRAAELYGGGFLEDVRTGAEEFESWAQGERGQLAAAAARVFEACARQADASRDAKRAVDAVERLLSFDPLRETWHRLALGIYARHFGREAALTRAAALIELLRNELGVSPEDETLALLDEIRRAPAPDGDAAIPHRTVAVGAGTAADPDAGAMPERDRHTDRSASPPGSEAAPQRFHFAPAFLGFPAPAGFAAAAAVVALFFVWSVLAHRGPESGRTAPGIGSPPGARARLDPAARSAETPELKAEAIVPLVVLPFVAEGDAGPEVRRMADILTDDLSGLLTKYVELRIIWRQTAALVGRETTDVAAAGSLLGVPYAVGGRLRMRNGRFDLHVELVKTDVRLTLWADHIEGDVQELGPIGGELAKRISRAIQIQIMYAQGSRMGVKEADASSPADLVARARATRVRGVTRENLRTAAGLYEEALRRDPHYVPAMVGMAQVIVSSQLNLVAVDPALTLDRAETLLQAALDRNPGSAPAHYWMGLLFKARGQFDTAQRSIEHALELNPSFASAYAQLGDVLVKTGHPAEGLRKIRYAIDLSPQDPFVDTWYIFAGAAEIALGHYREAVELLLRANAINSQSPVMHGWLAAAYAMLGEQENVERHAALFRRYAAPSSADRFLELSRRAAFRAGAASPMAAALNLAFGPAPSQP